MTEDLSIMCEYLKENGFDVYAGGDEIYMRLSVGGKWPDRHFDIRIWPGRFIEFYSFFVGGVHLALPHIESPNYIEELKDVLVKAAEILDRWSYGSDYGEAE